MDSDRFAKFKYIFESDCSNVAFSVVILVKWLVFGVGTGIIVGLVATGFSYALAGVNSFRAAHSAVKYALPLAGLVIVFLYSYFKDENDTGTNMVISSIHSSSDIPFKMAPLIFISTVLTHLCGGSAGREGAAIQIGGSIANRLGKSLSLKEHDHNIIVMCGMSAGFSALFGTPLAAAVFSLEVISVGIMHYAALVPCVIASFVAHFVADALGVEAECFNVGIIPQITPVLFTKMLVLGAVFGGVSIMLCLVLHKAEHTYKSYFKNPYVRIFAAGCIIAALSAILGTDMYLGSGANIISGIFETGRTPWYTFILKIAFTALTLGAGYKGGEIVPSFCVGAAFGCAVSGLFGLPASLAAACGMAGVFCGVTNCPITSLLISFELFGYEGMPYYLVSVAVSYMFSGYYGLYRSQRIMYSKTETHFVNTKAR